jgi:hypothetical protein
LVAGAYVALALAGFGCAEADPAGGAGAGGAAGFGLPSGGAGGMGAGPAGGAMPCEVQTIVTEHCGRCHGATKMGGAPMSLLTAADFQVDYAVVTTPQLAGQTLKMSELAHIRVNREMNTMPMPQGSILTPAQLTTFNTWLKAGAPAGQACTVTAGSGGAAGDAAGGIGGTMAPAGAGGMMAPGGAGGEGGMGTVDPTGPSMIEDQCTKPGAFEPLVAQDGETCYDFYVHGAFGVDDRSKFTVIPGESYNQFYYNVPWPAGSISTRYGQNLDNINVSHHWLAFSQTFGMPAGTVEPNVLGTTLFTDAELIAGWAVGGCTTTYPANVGVHVPQSGTIMIQWHHYNTTPTTQEDGSAVQICVVPEAMREHKAGLTFLGTENIAVPAGGQGQGGGTCYNDSSGPITIIGFNPHMHEIGIHMKSDVVRAAGGEMETVFDRAFQFDYQTNYMMNPPVVLQPNDAIISTCTWENKAARSVGFGQSTKDEMCYQFALSYPYGELNNGIGSLIGATNTCW